MLNIIIIIVIVGVVIVIIIIIIIVVVVIIICDESIYILNSYVLLKNDLISPRCYHHHQCSTASLTHLYCRECSMMPHNMIVQQFHHYTNIRLV